MPGKDSPNELLAYKRLNPDGQERQLDELVADWVGEDAAPGVLGKFHRQPKKIGEAVDRFLTRIHQDESVLLEKISASWKQITGEQISAQLVPLEIKGQTLVISAQNQTYLYVFQQPQMKAPILKNLAEVTQGRVTDFRIVSQGRR